MGVLTGGVGSPTGAEPALCQWAGAREHSCAGVEAGLLQQPRNAGYGVPALAALESVGVRLNGLSRSRLQVRLPVLDPSTVLVLQAFTDRLPSVRPITGRLQAKVCGCRSSLGGVGFRVCGRRAFH
jgi:hypothetical protein